MNNLQKRTLSLLLSGVMTLSMAGQFTALAEDVSDSMDSPVITQEQGASTNVQDENTLSESTPPEENTSSLPGKEEAESSEENNPEPESTVPESNEVQDPATEAALSVEGAANYVQVSAAEGIAQIGDAYYATLSDAVGAATAGQTITLLQDVQLGDAILVDRDLTILAPSGATRTISRAEGYTGPLFVQNDGVLTMGESLSDDAGFLVLDGGAEWLVDQVVTDGEGNAVLDEQGQEKKETVEAGSPAVPEAYDGQEASEAALITVASGELYLQETVTLQNNHSKVDGGALSTVAGDDAKIYLNGTMTGNATDGNGGAYSGNGQITIGETATFTGNCAAGNGGALWLDGKTLIEGGTFTGNRADQGGALYAAASDEAHAIRISGGIFTGNEAKTGADAVLVPDDAPSEYGWTALSGGATFGDAYIGAGKYLAVAGALSGTVNLTVGGESAGQKVVCGQDYTLTQADAEHLSLQSENFSLQFASDVVSLQNKEEENRPAAQSETAKAYFNNEAYPTLDAAVDALNASSAAEKTLVLTRDDTLSKTITLSSGTLKISAEDAVTVTRASGFKASAMLRVSGGELVLENVKFDGGAAWSGSTNSYLQRGTSTQNDVSSPLLNQTGGKVTLKAGSALQNNSNPSGAVPST